MTTRRFWRAAGPVTALGVVLGTLATPSTAPAAPPECGRGSLLCKTTTICWTDPESKYICHTFFYYYP
jgi:hypothetical protein